MNNLQKSVLFAVTLIITGCGQSQKQELTDVYLEAVKKQDVETLSLILANPENANMFSADRGLSIADYSYTIMDEIDSGVNVKYTRPCYDDIIIPTIIKVVDGYLKVDVIQTIKGHFKGAKSSKPNKKYCYEFADTPLQGRINNSPWKFEQIHQREVNWGSHTSTSTKLYSEKCDVETFGSCKKTSLIISNLDLEGEGGNFNHQENITIHTPPSDNIIVSEGSYRITNTKGSNAKKIEISFSTIQGNKLNGYFIKETKG